jgi:hypothetical protein
LDKETRIAGVFGKGLLWPQTSFSNDPNVHFIAPKIKPTAKYG